MNTKNKKPFYKRWWVWVCAVLVFIGFVSNPTKTDNGGSDVGTRSTITEANAKDNTKYTVKDLEIIDETEGNQADKTEEQESNNDVVAVKTVPTFDNQVDEQAPKTSPERTTPVNEIESKNDESEAPTDNSPTVYISSSGKIHKVPDCSGMKSYKEMTQNEVEAKNYEYCKNCW